MNDFNIEYYAARYPLEVTRTVDRDLDYFMRTPGPVPPNYEQVVTMTFRHPERLETIEQVALMYYQFDKFMKERFGDYIQAYQDAERARRIDGPHTESVDTDN